MAGDAGDRARAGPRLLRRYPSRVSPIAARRWDQAIAHRLELLLGLLVVFVAPDVQPVVLARPRAHDLPRGDQPQDQVGEVQALSGLDERQRARREAVDAHARGVVDLRLLVIAGQTRRVGVVAKAQHPQRHLDLASLRGDRRRGVARAMALDQRAVVDVGEHVAVHHQDVVRRQALDQRQRADRAERLVLAVVVDRDAVRLAVAEERLDQLGQVAGGDRDPLEPMRACSWRTTMSSTGRSPIGISGLGRTVVYGRRRVPSPPARITARFTLSDCCRGTLAHAVEDRGARGRSGAWTDVHTELAACPRPPAPRRSRGRR